MVYLYSTKDITVYAIDKNTGILKALLGEIEMSGKEKANSMELYNGDALLIYE